MASRCSPRMTRAIDRELRVSYFSDDQSWGKTKGIDRAPQNAGEHIGPGLSPQSSAIALIATRRGFGPPSSTARARGGPKRAITASAANDAMGQDSTTSRPPRRVSPSWPSPGQGRLRFFHGYSPAPNATPPMDRLRSATPNSPGHRGRLCSSVNASPAATDRSAAPRAMIRIGFSKNRSPSMKPTVWAAIIQPRCTRRECIACSGGAGGTCGCHYRLSRQSGGELYFLSHAQGRGPVAAVALYRPSHPRPSPAGCRSGSRSRKMRGDDRSSMGVAR